MKRFVYAALCVVSLCLSGCGYDDDEVWNAINDQEERIAALEEWQKTANENIAALQAIVNGNDYITSVEEIKEGDEIIGYTINFHRQGEVTIYNGKDGEKGDMPVIGVSEGEDGRWYWTVNGELLEDADGNPVCANGKDGEDGEDGEDGADGSSSSGVTPVIKLGVELGPDYNQYASYLSVDGGKTWTQMNVALDGYGSVLEKVEWYRGYYEFQFHNQEQGYYSIIRVPEYTGGLQFRYEGAIIYNGKLAVEVGEGFSITIVEAVNEGEWRCDTESTNEWSFTQSGNTLTFKKAPEAGKSFLLEFTYVDGNNKVTNYEIMIATYETKTISNASNPALVQALANWFGTDILNEDGDVEVTPELIQNTTYFDISEKQITSLDGLEAFANLEVLYCSYNPLASLDVSAFSKLRELYCSGCFNQTSTIVSRSESFTGTLDLSKNTQLEILECTNNEALTSIVLPNTSTLYWINCVNNKLVSLDVSGNPRLTYLNCEVNPITSIDLSQNTLLVNFYATDNQLTEVDLSNNLNLQGLSVAGNRLDALDVSKNVNLNDLACGRQYDNTRQLVLTLNESQKTLWESSWSSSIMNTNVVVASSSYTTAIKVNLVTQGNPTPAPLEGVTVTVYDSAENGNVIGTWTTNAEGIALVEHTQSTIYYTISKAGYSDTVLESVSGPNGVIAGWRVVGVDEDGNFEYLDYNGDMIWNLDDVVTNVRYSYTITDGEPYPCCMFSIE